MPAPRRGVCLVLAVLAVLIQLTMSSALAQGGGGVTPNSTGCTPSPCPARASIGLNTEPPASAPPESGPYTYQALVTNIGDVTGAVSMICSSATGQVPCVSVVPSSFALAAGASQTVTVSIRTLGLGKFLHKIKAEMDVGKSDSAMRFVTVTGPSITKHANPLDKGPLALGDTLRMTYSHASGINTASVKLFLDGRDSTSRAANVKTASSFEARSLRMAVGDHVWQSYVCATNGRCDSLKTTFSASEVPPIWTLDDSLPPPVTEPTLSLLPGALPLPVDSLRGCARGADDPEIRLSGPFSYFFQASPTPSLQGFIFMAAFNMRDSLQISALTVDHTTSETGKTCASWVWLNESQYDWNFWQHSDPNDPYWAVYPYGDRSGAGPSGLMATGGGTASPDTEEAMPAGGANTGKEATKGGGGITPQIIGPGAIDPASYWVKLNGTLIVNNGLPVRATVKKTSLDAGGSTFMMATSDGLFHHYNFATPAADSGGWNTIIASIADLTGHRTYVRSRFVIVPPPPSQPLTLTPLRDFTHSAQADCAAFGAFQCGGVALQQEIAGFVTRDKPRNLHLVYRSGSQLAPTLLNHRLTLSRDQRTPDSLWVEVLKGAALLPGKLRYAGSTGGPTGPGIVAFQKETNEKRVIAAEVAAPLNNKDSIRTLTTRVRTWYPDLSSQDNVVSQEVVQLLLTDTVSTRFGSGWQLAEMNRLVLGQSLSGAPAAIWISGDGSYTIFRKQAGVWVSPQGETAHLVDSTVTTGLKAAWVLFLESGATIGFRSDGRQKFTMDLVGNATTYTYSAAPANRLTQISDPTGTRFEFQYNNATAKGQVTDIFVRPAGGTLTKVATLGYDGTTRFLTSVKIWRSTTAGDVTTYGYATGTSYGALLTTVTDPRSTTSAPIITYFGYDGIGTPVSMVRPPERAGAAAVQFRDHWRRPAPRIGFGRGALPLERVLYESQVRGTLADVAFQPTDFTVDAFGGPTLVRRISPPPIFTFPFGTRTYGGDDVRAITRDAVGRVTRIVHAPDSAAISDSLKYEYDALSRVQRVIRSTLQFPVPGNRPLDTLTFTYDSVTLAPGKEWCSRLLKSQGSMGAADTTVIRYGASGLSRCLPSMAIGVAKDTTRFTYGTLAAGQPSGVRPITIKPQLGPTATMQYDATTWNSKAYIRQTDNATTTAWYGPFGRIDSVKAPDGVRTWTQYDLSGRVLRSKTGSGTTAPTTATTYDASGNVVRVDVYRSPDNDLMVQSTPPQTTLTFYDRLSRVDSVIAPGGRPGARKQSFIRDVYGNPFYQFSGNGSYVGRTYDWQGRLKVEYHSYVDPSRSVDGERFADANATAVYNDIGFTLGPALSSGQYYARNYDNKGREIYARGQEEYLGDSLYTRRRGYSRVGALIADTLFFTDGVRIIRSYTYDRHGNRLGASDVVSGTNGWPVTEPTGSLTYAYDLADRLQSIDGAAGGTSYARARWTNDLIGRATLRGVLLGGSIIAQELITDYTYDASGRDALIHTHSAAGDWYKFSFPTYDVADQLKAFDVKQTHGLASQAQLGSATMQYSADGTRRLKQSSKTVGPQTRGYTWTYDGVGNQTKEAGTGGLCSDTDTLTYGADNRLERRWSPGCTGIYTRYWSDQAGNRLAEADSIEPIIRDFKATMTYTSANQLYFSMTPAASRGSFDLNWHWYDADGLRIVSHVSGVSAQTPMSVVTNYNPNAVGGARSYTFYDGGDVALVVVKLAGVSRWTVRQRFLSSGTDQPLAGRFVYNDVPKNLALVADRGGSTQVAIQPDGTPELNAQYFDRSPFGSLEGATGAGGTINPETGFAGATTPNQSGGFTYLRNRWYDPQTGRFLSQDPIGLVGGVNLYAYAGNNPVAYTDPFGLCPWCAVFEGGVGVAAAGALLLTAGTAILAGDNLSDAFTAGIDAGGSIITSAHEAIGNLVGAAAAATGWEGLSEGDLKGKSTEEIEKMVPPGWTREPTREGDGTRYKHPTNRGEQIRVQPGKPTDPNPVKQGPYCRISCGGKTSDPIPLKGNPTLGN